MRPWFLLSAVLAAAALARAAPAQQPKPVTPPVVVQPVKPMPMPATTKAQPATPAKTAARKYPVVITTPALQLLFSTKPRSVVAFTPRTITTPTLQLALVKPGAAAPAAPFKPRTIRTDSLKLLIAPHP